MVYRLESNNTRLKQIQYYTADMMNQTIMEDERFHLIGSSRYSYYYAKIDGSIWNSYSTKLENLADRMETEIKEGEEDVFDPVDEEELEEGSYHPPDELQQEDIYKLDK